MSRLRSSGFELNSKTSDIEFDFVQNSASSDISIDTSTVRSGSYSGKIALTAGAIRNFRLWDRGTINAGPFFARAYFNFASFPNATSDILVFGGSTGGFKYMGLAVTSGGLLQLYNGSTQVGSSSSALSTGTWYRLEIKIDNTGGAGAGKLHGLIDGTDFASSDTLTLGSSPSELDIGANLGTHASASSGTWNIDDMALNDSTGSFQTSYPGSGKIIHLKPNASGDTNSFATQTGGTAGSSNNFTRVSEITPDDATTFNGSNTLNQEDLFNCDDSGIGASDTVNVVSVGARFRNNTADATTAVKFEIEKAASGTITQSSAIVPNTTTWNTNTTADPRTYPITTYQDPNSSSWAQSTLDSMQVGYKLTTGGTNRIDISTVWALVDYTPVSDFTVNASDSSTLSESLSSYSDTIFTRESIIIQITTSIDLSLSDTVTLSESTNLLINSFSSVIDTITTSESLKLLVESSINSNDSVSINENIQLLDIENVSLNDNVLFSESSSVLIPIISVSTSDSLTISESLQIISIDIISIAETIITSENVQVFIPFLTIQIQENLLISESMLINSIDATASDAANISESLAHYSDQIDLMELVIVQIAVPNMSVSDSLSLSESIKALITSFIAINDTITLSEFSNVALADSITTSDSITLSESAILLNQENIISSDSMTITESRDILLAASRDIAIIDNRLLDENGNFLLDENGNYITDESPSEFLFISESISIAQVYNVVTFDSIVISENVIVSYTIPGLALSDTITFSESRTLLSISNVSVSDSSVFSESIKLLNEQNIVVSETITTSESQNFLIPTLFISVSSSVVLNEAILIIPSGGIGVLESISLNESINVYINVTINTSDSATISENRNVAVVDDVVVSDLATFTESTKLLSNSLITVAELITLTESNSLSISEAGTISDTTTISESIQLSVNSFVLTNDGILASELIDIRVSLTIVVADAIVISEQVIITGRNFVPRLTLLGIG